MLLCLHRCGGQDAAALSICSRVTISVAHQRVALLQLGIPAAQVEAADNLFVEQPLAPGRRGFGGLKNELVEARRAGEEQLCARLGAERFAA